MNFYMEIAMMLLDQCKDEFENHKQTKSLINDLFELRRDKLMRIMKKIDNENFFYIKKK